MKKLFTIILLVFILFSQNSCLLYRGIRYYTPDIDEYNAFPQAKISKGESPFIFPSKKDSITETIKIKQTKNGITTHATLDEYLNTTSTTAFIIIKNDTVVFENYYNGYYRSDISTLFSTTKSVVSLLVGIAVDEGEIKSVNDFVTDYVPELKDADSNFQKLTIEHLLNMQAGLDFNESYTNPFKDMARLFYGRDQLRQLKKLNFSQEPGFESDYNSATTALLGIVLERAVKRPFSEYLQDKVWKPLGMEYDATVNLDDKKHRSAKSYQGLNATAVDLAKIGRLYVNNGKWGEKQIVSKSWIEKCTTPNIEPDHFGYKYKGYQYHWYSSRTYFYDSLGNFRQFPDSLSALNFAQNLDLKFFKIWKNRGKNNSGNTINYHWEVTQYHPQYHTLGILDQILFVDPERKIIIVRLGKDWSNVDNFFLYSLSKCFPKIN